MTLETGVKELAEAVGADVKALEDGKANSNDARITGAAQKSANLSDLASASAARQNLELGTAATRDVATNAQALVGTAGVLPDAAGVHAAFKQFGYGGPNPSDLALNCNDLPAGSRNSWTDGISESTAVSLNLPALGGSSSDSRSWHVECFGRGSNRLVQEATEVYGVGTTRGRTFTRVKHDATWYPWAEVLRTGAYGLGDQSIAALPATQLNWNAFFAMNIVLINSSGPFASYLGISQNTASIISSDGNNTTLNAELIHTGNILATTGQSTLYPMTQKAVTDALNNKVDKVVAVTGSITLNGTTNNTVAMTDIVTELDLEVGDVIRIYTGAYNKLHTVESITNNSSIIVNYEHAGNRGNGSLKLPDTTAQSTVTRIAKWFNAPVGVGQAWVDVTDFRSAPTDNWGTTYFNTTGRTIDVSLVSVHEGSSSTAGCFIMVDGWALVGGVGAQIGGFSGNNYGVIATVPFNSPYQFQRQASDTEFFVRELR